MCIRDRAWAGTEKFGPVKLASCDLRDGQQSVIATRMKTEDMVPILTPMDDFGFECLEVWGGATFDSCIRFLREDPWERLRTIKPVSYTHLDVYKRQYNSLALY